LEIGQRSGVLMTRRRFLRMTSKATVDVVRGKIPSMFAIGDPVRWTNSSGKTRMGQVSFVHNQSSDPFLDGFHYYVIVANGQNFSVREKLINFLGRVC